MKKTICLLLALCCVLSLCACGGSIQQQKLDLSKLSKNTTYEDIVSLLGDNHSEREDESRAIRGEVYHITYPKGTVLSGLEASSDVYVEFFQSSNTISEIHFDFLWEGKNIDNFYTVKESLDKVYGQATEPEKIDHPWAPDLTFRWRDSPHPEVFCYAYVGEDSRLCLCF